MSDHDSDNIPCKTPSPRSSASQVPPNPRHNADEPPPRFSLPQPVVPPPAPPRPFRGLSKRFMGGKGFDHRRGRSEGAYDVKAHVPPNVKDRVRKWQEAGGGVVTQGDVVEVPPISPATPTPGTRRGMPEHRRSTLASEVPLEPPRVVGKAEWDSASEAEKEAERQKIKNKERERKLKRRRDRERAPAGSTPGAKTQTESGGGTPAATPLATNHESPLSPPQQEQKPKPSYEDDGIRVTPIVDDNDGIRVTPIKTKRAGSKRKKKSKEKSTEERAAEGQAIEERDPVAEEIEAEKQEEELAESPPSRPCADGADADSATSSKLKPVKTWEDDGIRIYASSPVKSDRTGRVNSVRQSSKSVKSRKEEFEAQMKKERAANEQVRKMFRKQEEEEAEEERLEQVGDLKPSDNESQKPPVLPASQNDGEFMAKETLAPKKPWEDYDDGIRVRPLKTRKTSRRRDGPEGADQTSFIASDNGGYSSTNDHPATPTGFNPPPKFTESAPATPTGRTQLRRDTEPSTPLSVKDRARRFDQGVDASATETVKTRKKRDVSSMKRENRLSQDYTSPIETPPPTRRSQTEDAPSPHAERAREQRRQGRRELRKMQDEAKQDRERLAEIAEKAKARDRYLESLSRQTPEVPPRPQNRRKSVQETRRRSVHGAPLSSTEDLSLKREKSKSTQSTPFSSRDSLPLKTEKKSQNARSTPVVKEALTESRKTSNSTPPSESLSFQSGSTQKTSPPIERDPSSSVKKKPQPLFGPKIASATSSFFKAVKEEFQGRSVGPERRSADIVSDDDADAGDAPRGQGTFWGRGQGRRVVTRSPSPVSSTSEESDDADDESDEPPEIVKRPSVKHSRHRRKQEPPASGSSSASSCTVSSTESATESEHSVKKAPASDRSEGTHSESEDDASTDSMKEGLVKKGPIREPVKKELVKEPAKKGPVKESAKREPVEEPVKKEPVSPPPEKPEIEPEPVPAEPPAEVPPMTSQESKSPVAEDTPGSVPLRPKRHIRKTTAPPRPKSIHSRKGSDGSVTPVTSVCDDDESIDGSVPARTISEASTVKPLRVTKVKPSTERPPEPSVTQPSSEEKPLEEDPEDWYNPEVSVKSPTLKRRFTKHSDLISILSVPKSQKSRRTKSVRSEGHSRQRKAKKHVETLTIPDLLKELAADEIRYMRELKTLVEDVVPVLFQTVLGRADDDLRRTASTSSSSTAATGTTRSSRAGFSSNPTRPIVDMGITLERLRTLHERIPIEDYEQLLMWAGDARRVYEEYLSVWRMGFQDVVVSMPPPDENEQYLERGSKDANIRKELEVLHGKPKTEISLEGDPLTWAMPPPPDENDEPRDEKVDVAFLLKRPLVRLKVLSKLFKRIHYMSSSEKAGSLSNSFHALVTVARRKISDEKARLEDEAAASLDITKACDVHLLQSLSGVFLDPARRVRARDSFSMRLYHSSGRMIEVGIELILRDPSPRSKFSEAEVLFVEVAPDATKWLLFPPITLSNVSARTGDAAGEIVVMVIGLDKDLQEWREVMALASSTAAGFEWVQMLGLTPIPPEGPFCKDPHEMAMLETVIEESIAPSRIQTPVLRMPKRKKKTGAEFLQSRLASRQAAAAAPEGVPATVLEQSEASETEKEEKPVDLKLYRIPDDIEIPRHITVVPSVPADKLDLVGGAYTVPADIDMNIAKSEPETPVEKLVERSPSLHTLSEGCLATSKSSLQRSKRATRPSQARRKSLVQTEDLEESVVESAKLGRSLSVHHDDDEDIPTSKSQPQSTPTKTSAFDNVPVLSPTPAKTPAADAPPPVPPHRSGTTGKRSSSVVSSASDSPPPSIRSGFALRRRTSSPLKHEYAPSSPSESASEEEELEDEEDGGAEVEMEIHHVLSDETESYSSSTESTITTDSSGSSSDESDDSLCSEEEDEDDTVSVVSSASQGVAGLARKPSIISLISVRRKPSLVAPSIAERSMTGQTEDTIGAESHTVIADQSRIPPPDASPPPIPSMPVGINFRAIVFKWAISQWEKLPSGECKLVVTPGCLEAFPLVSSLSSTPNASGPGTPVMMRSEPSIAELASQQSELIFTLTLLAELPIRRGTAVDVTIKTPKMSSFSGANIMLRSRSPAECESLFNALLAHRMQPPNYQESTLLSTVPSEMDTSVTSMTFAGSVKRGFAWTRGRTYRAGGSTSTPSLVSTPSETSVNSLSSAFSRLRFFNRSSLSSTASSSEGGFIATVDGLPEELSRLPGIDNWVIAMTPLKCRLYRRESAAKWRELGSARLHAFKPSSMTEIHKRVVLTNKKCTTIFLDKVLGESAFERIARTGLAINVMSAEGEEDGTFKPGHVGGIGAKNTVYMMQMKGEAQTSFAFSVLGKLRY